MQTGLIPITCVSDGAVYLRVYADCLSYSEENGSKTLVLARIGGYPEMVKGISAAILGGSTITAVINGTNVVLSCKPKQYSQQISHDGSYAEGVLQLLDDELLEGAADVPSKKKPTSQDQDDAELEDMEQTAFIQPPRNCYIVCRPNDRKRLYEEIDRKSTAPMIPEFQDYLVEELQERGILAQLPSY